MRILIAGGTGTAGRALAEHARQSGHEVVVVSRRPSDAPGHVVADLLSGAGLDEAIVGVHAVIDASNIATVRETSATTFFTTVTRRLLAAEQRAGVAHHVVLSIVGVDLMPMGYYRAKLAQEAVASVAAERSDVGCSVVRVTQFHDFAALVLGQFRRGPFVMAPPLHIQPVDLRDVARHLLAVLVAGPVGRAPDLAGPRPEEVPDMVRRYAAAVGERVLIVKPPLLGAAGRANRDKVLRPSAGLRGTVTFDEWLATAARG